MQKEWINPVNKNHDPKLKTKLLSEVTSQHVIVGKVVEVNNGVSCLLP